MSTTREMALALCPHETRSTYALVAAAKQSLIDLAHRDINDRPGITEDVTRLEAYLSKSVELVAEIKRKAGVR